MQMHLRKLLHIQMMFPHGIIKTYQLEPLFSRHGGMKKDPNAFSVMRLDPMHPDGINYR